MKPAVVGERVTLVPVTLMERAVDCARAGGVEESLAMGRTGPYAGRPLLADYSAAATAVMFEPGAVWLGAQPVDIRLGIDGLPRLVQDPLSKAPCDGSAIKTYQIPGAFWSQCRIEKGLVLSKPL